MRSSGMTKSVIITGMHRSGTSLVANYLFDAGIYMDTKHLLEADNANIKGYYEDKRIIDWHNKLLLENGRYPFLSKGMRNPKVSEKMKSDLDDILSEYSETRLWGFKDPRTSLFLEFWHHHLHPNDRHYIFLFRDPYAVADSLIRRNGDFFKGRELLALQSWLIYNKNICRFISVHPSNKVSVILIDDFIQNPEDYLSRINKDHGLGLSKTSGLAPVFESRYFKAAKNQLLENQLAPSRWLRFRLKRCYTQLLKQKVTVR
jgi:hypothetical protein